MVNSHFHFDHVGGNKYLTNATTLVNTAELRHAKVPEPFEHLGYSDLSFDFPGTKYERISGDIEIADGIWLHETPGHTAGHYSLLVEMEDQPSMIFAGDAAYTYENLERLIVGGFHLDPTASVESLRRLKRLARTHDAQIYPSHEMAPFQSWKKAPSPGRHRSRGGMTRIGAATTHHEIETSAPMRARYPEMSAMISRVANLRVRIVGTLGGNLCFADPHSDPASFLMAVGATLVCQRGEVTRRIPAAGFLTGLYETALAPGELLVAIELPARAPSTGISHLRMKLTERPVVTVTALVTLTPSAAVAQARLIVGSVASVPFAADTVSFLGAGAADFGSRAEACAEAAAACTLLPDGEASPDYLSHLVRLHARQALGEAFAAAA